MTFYQFRIKKSCHFTVKIPETFIDSAIRNIEISISNFADSDGSLNQIKNLGIYF